MTKPSPRIAVIGGSGLYALFDPAECIRRTIATPYGTAVVSIGTLGGRSVAFLARHGTDHSVPPHLVNYRANIWALASLGVTTIVSSSAVGGLRPDHVPGTLVLTDQYIDRTHGREDTFYTGGDAGETASSVQHLASADPFDPTLHAAAALALASSDVGGPVATSGTVVVIQGPRFSTRAESLWFRAAGAHTVNMTLYPEVPLAAELNIATVNLSYVTDNDAAPSDGAHPDGEQGDGETLSSELVFDRLRDAQPRIIAAIESIIRAVPADYPGRVLIDPAAVADVLARPVVPA